MSDVEVHMSQYNALGKMQACDLWGFFLSSGFFTNLPLPETFLETREVATKERKKSPVLCPNL